MYTPRHLRRGQNSQGKDKEKQKAFRRAALWSKEFIGQSSEKLEGNPMYARWCASADRGSLRRAK